MIGEAMVEFAKIMLLTALAFAVIGITTTGYRVAQIYDGKHPVICKAGEKS